MNLEQTVAAMKAEVISLVKFGTISDNVKSFAQLHDFIDANELGGFCMDSTLDEMVKEFGGWDEDGTMPQGLVDFTNKAQDAVDDWLRTGGLHESLR